MLLAVGSSSKLGRDQLMPFNTDEKISLEPEKLFEPFQLEALVAAIGHKGVIRLATISKKKIR